MTCLDNILGTHTVVNGNGKRLARLEAMRYMLSRIEYTHKDPQIVGTPDPLIVAPPRMP